MVRTRFPLCRDLTLEQQFARGIFPVLKGNAAKFPEGESLDDLGLFVSLLVLEPLTTNRDAVTFIADRAEKAINELVLPHIRTAALEGHKNVHIALVSHGLCISKLIERLLLKDSEDPQSGDFRGLLNTAWTRLEVEVRVRMTIYSVLLDVCWLTM